METSQFITFVDEKLENLAELIEQTDTNYTLEDVEYQDGVLTLTLEDDRQYVINRHTPSRQIWLSSPVSGAGHFSHQQDDCWIDSKGRDLYKLLKEELQQVAQLNLPL